MKPLQHAVLLTTALMLSACATTDRVVFVTSTEIGIGADPTIGNVNIGYDRNELVISPGYPETGGVPPVYAKLETDMAVINPSVKQLYATGNAARAAVGTTLPEAAFDDRLYGERRPLVFGTTTNFGLKVQSVNGQAPAVNLGYKRKEYSLVPLRETAPTETAPDRYASVLAGIELRTDIQNASDPTVEGRQFIATGSAANKLASLPAVRQLFADEARKALALGAVKSVPLADSGLLAAVQPVCAKQAERDNDAQLDQKLQQIEARVGYGIAEFCTDPTQARLDQLSAEMKQANLL